MYICTGLTIVDVAPSPKSQKKTDAPGKGLAELFTKLTCTGKFLVLLYVKEAAGAGGGGGGSGVSGGHPYNTITNAINTEVLSSAGFNDMVTFYTTIY